MNIKTFCSSLPFPAEHFGHKIHYYQNKKLGMYGSCLRKEWVLWYDRWIHNNADKKLFSFC